MALTLRFSTNIAAGTRSCGGAIDRTAAGLIANTSALNSVFDKVLKHENIEGMTEYRLLYISNDNIPSNSKVYVPKIKFISVPQSEFSIAALPKNEVGQILISEKETPVDVVFKTQSQLNNESSGYLSFPDGGELLPGEFLGFWLERKVNSSSGSGTIKEELVLEIQYRS